MNCNLHTAKGNTTVEIRGVRDAIDALACFIAKSSHPLFYTMECLRAVEAQLPSGYDDFVYGLRVAISRWVVEKTKEELEATDGK